MAIVSKTNRDGIDVVIEVLQQKFYPTLLGYWQGGVTYTCYPRANKNRKEDNIIPEVSLDQKDYKEVLTDDKVDVSSFFIVDDSRTFQDDWSQYKQTVSIIFQCDLVALYAQTERADEQFNMDVARVIRKENQYVVGDIEIVEGIDNVYSDLTFNEDARRKIALHDMSNLHVLKVTFDVLYKEKCNRVATPVCSPASVRVNSTTYDSVASGATLDIPVHNSAGADVGTVDPGVEVLIPDVNYIDSNAVAKTAVYGTTVVCTPASTPTATGAIYKTGAEGSYLTGDDGDVRRGLGTDWYNLGFNNDFGNGLRFTGTTGGGYNGSAYVDINGNATTKALAYPDDIMLDHSKKNQANDTIIALWFNPLSADSVSNHLSNSPYTNGGYSDWVMWNANEMWNFFKNDLNTNGWLDYAPVDYVYSGASDRLWCSTGVGVIANYYLFFVGDFISRTSEGALHKTMTVRFYTLSELGL